MLCRELPPPRCSPQRHQPLSRDTDATLRDIRRDSTRANAASSFLPPLSLVSLLIIKKPFLILDPDPRS